MASLQEIEILTPDVEILAPVLSPSPVPPEEEPGPPLPAPTPIPPGNVSDHSSTVEEQVLALIPTPAPKPVATTFTPKLSVPTVSVSKLASSVTATAKTGGAIVIPAHKLNGPGRPPLVPAHSEAHNVIPDSGGRIKGLTIVKPVVVGNIARYFGKKREEDGHTHQWTVYLKPLPNEDYSTFIKKVHFKLHDSYANPNRIINKPPYEVTETGWGEFEVVIRVHFNDPLERPVSIYHILKLFQPGADPTITTKKQLVSETYDEIIFQEPTILMKSFLDSIIPLTNLPWRHEVDFEERKATCIVQINTAKTVIKSEIQELKEKLKLARATIDKFKEGFGSIKIVSTEDDHPVIMQTQTPLEASVPVPESGAPVPMPSLATMLAPPPVLPPDPIQPPAPVQPPTPIHTPAPIQQPAPPLPTPAEELMPTAASTAPPAAAAVEISTPDSQILPDIPPPEYVPPLVDLVD